MLKDSFNKEIENLTELFLELMNEVKIIETSDMWRGKVMIHLKLNLKLGN